MMIYSCWPRQDSADRSATSNTTSASLIRVATAVRVWIVLANSSASARRATPDHVARLRYFILDAIPLFLSPGIVTWFGGREKVDCWCRGAHHREHLINGWFNQGHRSSPRLPNRFSWLWWQIWLILIWFPLLLFSLFPSFLLISTVGWIYYVYRWICANRILADSIKNASITEPISAANAFRDLIWPSAPRWTR